MKSLECRSGEGGGGGGGGGEGEGGEEAGGGGGGESRGTLRARLADAERLVRRLRGDAERQRREVLAGAAAAAAPGGAVTNLLFDGAAARHAHVRRTPQRAHTSRPNVNAKRCVALRHT